MMQSLPTRNISLVPWSVRIATTSLALATHPSQSSSMMGGAQALLSLKRSWWRRRILMREQVGPPKSARHDSSLLALHSNIQAAAGLPQGAHALCHWCWAPFQEAGQPPMGQQGSAGVQLEMKGLGYIWAAAPGAVVTSDALCVNCCFPLPQLTTLFSTTLCRVLTNQLLGSKIIQVHSMGIILGFSEYIIVSYDNI